MAATNDKKNTRSSADEQSAPDEADRDTFLEWLRAQHRERDAFFDQLEAQQRELEESAPFRVIQGFKRGSGVDPDLEALRSDLGSLLVRRPDIKRSKVGKEIASLARKLGRRPNIAPTKPSGDVAKFLRELAIPADVRDRRLRRQAAYKTALDAVYGYRRCKDDSKRSELRQHALSSTLEVLKIEAPDSIPGRSDLEARAARGSIAETEWAVHVMETVQWWEGVFDRKAASRAIAAVRESKGESAASAALVAMLSGKKLERRQVLALRQKAQEEAREEEDMLDWLDSFGEERDTLDWLATPHDQDVPATPVPSRDGPRRVRRVRRARPRS